MSLRKRFTPQGGPSELPKYREVRVVEPSPEPEQASARAEQELSRYRMALRRTLPGGEASSRSVADLLADDDEPELSKRRTRKRRGVGAPAPAAAEDTRAFGRFQPLVLVMLLINIVALPFIFANQATASSEHSTPNPPPNGPR